MILNENINSEDNVILNSRLKHLYNHEFEAGRFFQVVFSDENQTDIKVSARTLMKIVYIKENDNVEGIEIVKYVSDHEKQRVKFSKFNVQQLKNFLQFITSIDLKGITERRIVLSDDTFDVLDEETKRKISTLLSASDGGDVIKELLNQGIITSQDLVNTGYRKQQIELFRKLLDSKEFFTEFKSENDKKRDEDVWQFLFENNKWIFGYGLNFMFNSSLDNKKLEQIVKGNDFFSKGKRIDALLKTTGLISSFCFVEIKKSDDILLKKVQDAYREESWQVSDAVSGGIAQLNRTIQISLKNISTKTEIKDEQDNLTGEEIYMYKPKAFLIIGNLREFFHNDRVNETKFSSFELFRRELKNIEIITYDELFNRAKFIIENENFA